MLVAPVRIRIEIMLAMMAYSIEVAPRVLRKMRLRGDPATSG